MGHAEGLLPGASPRWEGSLSRWPSRLICRLPRRLLLALGRRRCRRLAEGLVQVGNEVINILNAHCNSENRQVNEATLAGVGSEGAAEHMCSSTAR